MTVSQQYSRSRDISELGYTIDKRECWSSLHRWLRHRSACPCKEAYEPGVGLSHKKPRDEINNYQAEEWKGIHSEMYRTAMFIVDIAKTKPNIPKHSGKTICLHLSSVESECLRETLVIRIFLFPWAITLKRAKPRPSRKSKAERKVVESRLASTLELRTKSGNRSWKIVKGQCLSGRVQGPTLSYHWASSTNQRSDFVHRPPSLTQGPSPRSYAWWQELSQRMLAKLVRSLGNRGV